MTHKGFTKAMIRNSFLVSFVFSCQLTLIQAQIFPDLSGEELVEALQENYTPSVLLNDAQAKDTLYFRVWRRQDSVRCIYTGLSRFLPDGVDPSQFLYGTGQEVESLNLEHSWPQSKGAGDGTDGNVNMYHLFPSRSEVNSVRADFPFQDIPDGTTQRWYYRNIEMNTVPAVNKDAYSEFAANKFEPRESVKGDLARALFYFWTIYRNDALAADPVFFSQQLETLCQWHQQDPVDAEESLRNEVISFYQDDKVNPFILDCSLVMRAYCDNLPSCITGNSNVPNSLSPLQLKFSNQDDRFSLSGLAEGQTWMLRVFDSAGRVLIRQQVAGQDYLVEVNLPFGYYFAVAEVGTRSVVLGFAVL